MSVRKGDNIFLEGICSLKVKHFQLAERKFKEIITRRMPRYDKAMIIYQVLLIKKECERLIKELKGRF